MITQETKNWNKFEMFEWKILAKSNCRGRIYFDVNQKMRVLDFAKTSGAALFIP